MIRSAVGALFLLTGCGLVLPGTPVMRYTYSLDGVKLISSAIARGDDRSTWDQDVYELSPERRLLLRFESLSDHVRTITLEEGRTVQLSLRLAAPDDRAREVLRLCPVTRSWMMLATWQHAHPYGPSGRWDVPGGDIDGAGCVTGTPGEDARMLVFDIRDWFVSYARGRNENHGLMLLSSRNVRVVGDRSGNHSPRILFNRYVPAP